MFKGDRGVIAVVVVVIGNIKIDPDDAENVVAVGFVMVSLDLALIIHSMLSCPSCVQNMKAN